MNLDQVRFDERGLIPAIVQDAESGEVLMLAYMNGESLNRTLETGETHFWSRSRQELWHKGKTSGNTQAVVAMRLDCDGDALLLRVLQKGVACHTGQYSCFYRSIESPMPSDGQESESSSVQRDADAGSLGEVLGGLARRIHERNVDRPESSYTAKLLNGGIDRILKKIGEESGEVIIAAKNHKREEILWESADLLYHLMVMWEAEGVHPADIARELAGRGRK
jgi:phosphoribosyl-AMP cyclohydrolase / phosphoribosyl-ATP pyrophosphohydrolase